MPFTIEYHGGQVQQPDAHSAAQQVKYLLRDGYKLIQIIDPAGNEITAEELGKLAFDGFKAPSDA